MLVGSGGVLAVAETVVELDAELDTDPDAELDAEEEDAGLEELKLPLNDDVELEAWDDGVLEPEDEELVGVRLVGTVLVNGFDVDGACVEVVAAAACSMAARAA